MRPTIKNFNSGITLAIKVSFTQRGILDNTFGVRNIRRTGHSFESVTVECMEKNKYVS